MYAATQNDLQRTQKYLANLAKVYKCLYIRYVSLDKKRRNQPESL